MLKVNCTCIFRQLNEIGGTTLPLFLVTTKGIAKKFLLDVIIYRKARNSRKIDITCLLPLSMRNLQNFKGLPTWEPTLKLLDRYFKACLFHGEVYKIPQKAYL